MTLLLSRFGKVRVFFRHTVCVVLGINIHFSQALNVMFHRTIFHFRLNSLHSNWHLLHGTFKWNLNYRFCSLVRRLPFICNIQFTTNETIVETRHCHSILSTPLATNSLFVLSLVVVNNCPRITMRCSSSSPCSVHIPVHLFVFLFHWIGDDELNSL